MAKISNNFQQFIKKEVKGSQLKEKIRQEKKKVRLETKEYFAEQKRKARGQSSGESDHQHDKRSGPPSRSGPSNRSGNPERSIPSGRPTASGRTGPPSNTVSNRSGSFDKTRSAGKPTASGRGGSVDHGTSGRSGVEKKPGDSSRPATSRPTDSPAGQHRSKPYNRPASSAGDDENKRSGKPGHFKSPRADGANDKAGFPRAGKYDRNDSNKKTTDTKKQANGSSVPSNRSKRYASEEIAIEIPGPGHAEKNDQADEQHPGNDQLSIAQPPFPAASSDTSLASGSDDAHDLTATPVQPVTHTPSITDSETGVSTDNRLKPATIKPRKNTQAPAPDEDQKLPSPVRPVAASPAKPGVKAAASAPVKRPAAKPQPATKEEEVAEQKAIPGQMPLNKFIAHAGLSSRRDAAEIVRTGKVFVNGKVILEPGFKVSEQDDVRVQGKKISARKHLVYILLNKPKDHITTTEDPEGRKTVMDIVRKATPERVYPVGRLDRNTTGVLILTNDGELTQKLSHPSYQVRKIYEVTLDRPLLRKDFDALLSGLTLEDGFIAPDSLAYADANDRKIVGIEIHSGRNRIVRRMFEQLGYDVRNLDRVMYANLTKKNVERGKWRFLMEKEIRLLKFMNASYARKH